MCIRTVTYMCRKGHYYSEQPPPGIQSNTGWCHPCADGSYMDTEEHNERHCRPCRTCTGTPNEYYKRRCDSVTNSECALCSPGQHAAPDGSCQSPTTKSSADPTMTSASTTHAATLAASATSSVTMHAMSYESTHSKQKQSYPAATIRTGSDGVLILVTSSDWRVRKQTNASASQDNDESPSVAASARASSTIIVDESLSDATSFPLTVNDIPLDARVTSLAAMSATLTIALIALLVLWLKRRDRERRGSSARLCSCSCRPSHVYQEPDDYDATYLEAPQHDESGRSSASTLTASVGEFHRYDYVQPYVSSHLIRNSGVNSSLLNGDGGSLGERLSSQMPASESDRRHCGEAGITLHCSAAAFSQALPSDVTHLRCDNELVLIDAPCSSKSHKSTVGCGEGCTKCGQPLHSHNATTQHAETTATDRIYAEID